MFIKRAIMIVLDTVDSIEYDELVKLFPSKDEGSIAVAVDWLAVDKYLDIDVKVDEKKIYIKKRTFASTKRYLHDYKMAILDRIIGIGSFIILIITIVLTAMHYS